MKVIIHTLILLSIGFTLCQCSNSKKKGDPGEFDGNYTVGKTSAIVFPIYEAYEIEFQIFGEPILFFFDRENKKGQFIYKSDDESMSFAMEPEHKKGTFYEINEPPLDVLKE